MENTTETNKNEITEKQNDYIKDLLINQRIDERYRRYVERALQNGVTRQQASKIIDFLTSLIAFKENFVRARNGNGKVFKPASFENGHKDMNQNANETIVEYTKID